jgi:hypothetical protein
MHVPNLMHDWTLASSGTDDKAFVVKFFVSTRRFSIPPHATEAPAPLSRRTHASLAAYSDIWSKYQGIGAL